MLFTKETWKHYGLPRSGTNYLKRILEQNYHVRVLTNEHGWKHGYYSPGFKSVCITKNVFAWLWSIHQHLETSIGLTDDDYVHLPFKSFIREPLKIQRRFWNNDPLPHTPESYKFDTPVHYWKEMNAHWQEFMPTIEYEKLIVHPEKCLDELGLRKKKIWTECEMATEPGDRLSSHKFNPNWYLKKEYLNNFSNDDIDHIKNIL